MKPSEDDQAENAGAPAQEAAKTNTNATAAEKKSTISRAAQKKLDKAASEAAALQEKQAKQEEAAKEKAKQDLLDKFKNSGRVKLDYIHAFGAYAGEGHYDIDGQVHLIDTSRIQFDKATMDQSGEQQDNMTSLGIGGVNAIQEAKGAVHNPFSNLQLIYPVGRHIALKSLDSQLMKFLRLPGDVKSVSCIALNNSKTLMAIAVKNRDYVEFEQQHLSVYFYTIGVDPNAKSNKKDGSHKTPDFFREKDYTIRATQGAQGLPQVEIAVAEDKKKVNTVGISGRSGEKVQHYERYISSIAFSKDDKFFAVCVRNGPSECHIQTYDFLMKGRKQCTEKFDSIIRQIYFMPRDNQKLMIVGDNGFQLHGVQQKKLIDMTNFTGIPNREFHALSSQQLPQSFTSFCYMENDQLVGCSSNGDLFVIEVMSVVQVIDSTKLIASGTPVGNRLQFKKVVACSSGFVAATDDILYFFKFKPSKSAKSKIKGTYHCILKWRAPEFKNTRITSINVYESEDQKNIKDSNLVVSTKDNQILYLNLYKQVYYPDYMQIQADFKKSSGGKDALTDSEASGDNSDQSDFSDAGSARPGNGRHGGSQLKIKSVGIAEEVTNDEKDQQNDGGNKALAKKEKENLIDKINYEVVGSGFHQGEVSSMDICIQRPIIATLSKADSTIRVWNYASGDCELNKGYHSLQNEFKNSNVTYLQSIALHPSGFYLAIAFIDKVKIYHLLDNDIREYRVLEAKGQHLIKFSNGGQYLACVDQKDLSVYYSYTLEKPRKISCPPDVSNLDFNDNDTLITISSKLGYIQKYDLTKVTKFGDGIIAKVWNFSSCIFTKDFDRNGKLQDCVYTVGQRQDKKQMTIQMYDQTEEKLEENCIYYESPFGAQKFTDIAEVKGPIPEPMEDGSDSKKTRARNFVVSSDDGSLTIMGCPPFLKLGYECEVMNSHHGAITQMKRSQDHNVLVTAGLDGVIFVYRVSEVPNLAYGKHSRKSLEKYEELEREEKRKKNMKRDREDKFETVNASQVSIPANTTINNEEEAKEAKEAGEAQPAAAQQTRQEDDFSESEDSDADIPEIIRQRRLQMELYAGIDDRLTNIVMIEKQMMEEWRKQQEQLKLDMEKENNTVESSLRREKYLYETDIAQMERAKSEHLNKLNKDYEDLQLQEAEEKDENTQTMKKMELNHLQCMEELQSLYEKKLQMEQQQYNQLASEKESLKNNYELEIKELKKTNEQSVEKLLSEFRINLQDVEDQYQNSKRTADGYKLMFEERLTQDEDQNKDEIDENKRVYAKEIEQLNDVITTIRDDIETIKRQTRREQEEATMYRNITDKAKLKEQYRRDLIKERDAEIHQLEIEKKEVQQKLKKKEIDLYGYKFKIKDLQKTKQVLTHRTQEMKASLEPKEQQIENLKEQLNDLEKVFKRQFKSLESLKVDLEKRKAKKEEYTAKVLKERERTKNRESFISYFVNDVHSAYENRNQDAYIEKLMDIYINYVSLSGPDSAKLQKLVGTTNLTDEILENKKKDPEVIEELDRQLQYMEKSIGTLKASTAKIQSKQKLNINKRRQENNYLIRDLEAVRQSKRMNQVELEKKKLTIQKLKLDKQKRQREFDKKLAIIEQETLNKVKAHGLMGAGNQNSTDMKDPNDQFDEDEIYKKAGVDADFFSGEQAQPSKVKGKIYKGTPFIRGNAEDKNKIIELQAQLEENNQQILLQKLEKRSLQEQIIRLLDERADDLGLTEDEKRAQLSQLNISPFHDGAVPGGVDDTQYQGQNQTFGYMMGGQNVEQQNQDIA